MSAALQLPRFFGAQIKQAEWRERPSKPVMPVAHNNLKTKEADEEDLPISLAFYRKHTESMLRRYLYASMQVGRAPSILSEPIARGWASSRPVRTFEDAVIFVLDIEKCLDRLGSLDRQLISRIVLQEYTQPEAASLLGMSTRAVSYKFAQALDRLTQKLLDTGLLMIPPS
ncbi:MAG: sigma factor-like helix-turn-helix DNA-binding protein [Terracidiphilus sp.]